MFQPLFTSDATFRKTLPIILILCFVTRLVLLIKPLPYLDGKVLIDDTYLSLEIARNIAHGKGPLYGDAYTNGFQPLYVFMMVPVYLLSADQTFLPVNIALFLLSLFDVATLCILLLWGWSMTKNLIATSLAAVFWTFNDYVIRTSLNGLETIMAGFFIVLACYQYYRMYYTRDTRAPKDFLLLGIIVGFGCFTRVDTGILALTLGLLIVFQERKNFQRLFLRAATYSVGVIGVFSIWIVYSMYYTGSWYPESGNAVRFMSLANTAHDPGIGWYWLMLKFSLGTERFENGLLLIFIGGLFVVLLFRRPFNRSHLRYLKFLLPLVLFVGALFTAYNFYIFTYWYFDRYFFPFILLFILLFIVLFDIVFRDVQTSVWAGACCLILVLWVGRLVTKERFVDFYAGPPDTKVGYMNLGLWAKDNLPDGAMVGSAQSGALMYFAPNLKVFNLDGVVSKPAFQSLKERNHMEYIRKCGIEYILGWQINIDFIEQHSNGYRKTDLRLIREIDGFTSYRRPWYLYKVNDNP